MPNEPLGKSTSDLKTAKNRVLVDFEQTLGEAEIQEGDCLAASSGTSTTTVPLPCGVTEIAHSLPGVN